MAAPPPRPKRREQMGFHADDDLSLPKSHMSSGDVRGVPPPRPKRPFASVGNVGSTTPTTPDSTPPTTPDPTPTRPIGNVGAGRTPPTGFASARPKRGPPVARRGAAKPAAQRGAPPPRPKPPPKRGDDARAKAETAPKALPQESLDAAKVALEGMPKAPAGSRNPQRATPKAARVLLPVRGLPNPKANTDAVKSNSSELDTSTPAPKAAPPVRAKRSAEGAQHTSTPSTMEPPLAPSVDSKSPLPNATNTVFANTLEKLSTVEKVTGSEACHTLCLGCKTRVTPDNPGVEALGKHFKHTACALTCAACNETILRGKKIHIRHGDVFHRDCRVSESKKSDDGTMPGDGPLTGKAADPVVPAVAKAQRHSSFKKRGVFGRVYKNKNSDKAGPQKSKNTDNVLDLPHSGDLTLRPKADHPQTPSVTPNPQDVSVGVGRRKTSETSDGEAPTAEATLSPAIVEAKPAVDLVATPSVDPGANNAETALGDRPDSTTLSKVGGGDETALPAKVLDALDHRYQVIGELVETEASFVRSLHVLVDHYATSFPRVFGDLDSSSKEQATLVRSVIPTLAVLHNFHKVLLADLQERWDGGKFDKFNGVFSDALTKVVPAIKAAHTRYVQSFGTASGAVRTLLANSKAFAAWAAEQKSSSELPTLDIQDLLIMPVQRVPRYALLLGDVVKRTPNSDDYAHPDAEGVAGALEAISGTASYINEQQAKHEQTIQVMNALLSLDGLTVGMTRINAQRRLVREGDLHDMTEVGEASDAVAEHETLVHFFLFSDLIIWAAHQEDPTKKKAKKKAGDDHGPRYNFIRTFYLQHVVVELVSRGLTGKRISVRPQRRQAAGNDGPQWGSAIAPSQASVASQLLRAGDDAETEAWFAALKECKTDVDRREKSREAKINNRLTFMAQDNSGFQDAIAAAAAAARPRTATDQPASTLIGQRDRGVTEKQEAGSRLFDDSSFLRMTFFAQNSSGDSIWPHESPSIDQMVEAGFLFCPPDVKKRPGRAGTSISRALGRGKKSVKLDCVRCRECKRSFYGWIEGDDPMAEHRRKSPDCAFVLSRSQDEAQGATERINARSFP